MSPDRQIVASRQVRFDEFELRPDEAVLLHRGRRLKLQPQPFRVLAYLVAQCPAVVSKEELGEHIWEAGVHVDLDQSLNYCIRQIRQVLDDSATQPRYVETLPRQGYRFIGRAEVVADWPPEALPETHMPRPPGEPRLLEDKPRNSVVDPAFADLPTMQERHVPGQLAGRVSRAAVALTALCGLVLTTLVVLWIRHSLRESSPTSRVRSLAVLPIENLSGDPGQEYLADGMTDELTTMLARDSTLRIVSRTSVMQYKGVRRPLPEVARALGADAVIEGSLARSGTRMHMTLQLIRADTDAHLWAESYDRDANDPTLPDQVARSIAAKLNNSTVPRTAAVRTIAPAAHDAYLRGRYLWPTGRMQESGAYFLKATEIQPDYAEAWAGLADFYGEGIAGDFLDPRINIRLEEESAERAMTLAPDLAASHMAMGAVYLIDRWDWKNADREVLEAIRLDPNDAKALYFRANVLEAAGRFSEAIEVEKKSVELAPFERPEALASIYVGARRYDEALADLKLHMETAPYDPMLLYTAAEVWRCKGNYKEATEAWAKWHIVTGDTRAAAALRRAYEVGGSRGFVRWQLERRLLRAKSTYVSPVELALYHAQLGDREHTLALLEEGCRQRSTDVLWIEDEPAYDFLHGESRYRALVQKIGQPAL